MRRRRFLTDSTAGLAAMMAATWGRPIASAASYRGRELGADVAVIGGGLGGCAAALAALRAGRSVVMTEVTDWVGGQLTSQAVPPDEHPWIEQFGRNESYAELRRRTRDYYRKNYPLTAEARDRAHLDPGNGSVSALCAEPRAFLAALTAMLAPYASAGRLTLLLEHLPVAAEVEGDRVRSVTVRDLATGDDRVVVAPYILDATELGDLLELAGVEHVVGFESRSSTGDRSAPEEAEPLNQQAITVCFPMEHRPGEDHTIDRPEGYEFWRDYVPGLSPPWSGPLLSLTYSNPRTLEPRTLSFDPTGDASGWWTYRRVLDLENFRPGAFEGSGGVTIVNWPQNDYLPGPLVGVSAEEAAGHVDRGKQLSLALLYWLQAECPRPDGGVGWPGLRLRPDLVGTSDGLAKSPYIRESRRIEAEFTVLERHVGVEARREAEGEVPDEATFPDSVGVGSYRIDLHPSTGGDNYIDVGSLPFEIPLGALIPRRVENLLPACKNPGTTHVTNGCYRLHPVEWAIGEAAGALAAFCLDRGLSPRQVRNTPERLREFQAALTRQGAEIHWPRARPR
ncbi:FAD-dependent oxidoreductase [Tautonia plasticadhaerens]|uniref:FAD dependent oxidoreductase n=1 Tax=Tautonia plasticadhaerens TaxID=2527974 RepID=A0A518H0Z4_9BACT|nr:FAD-dependent oxidoreductase [Tautonia plasticadhaerens]QDV34507.1 FAD dependent oxidoreductase [Tautonia plasticadhaerens]